MPNWYWEDKEIRNTPSKVKGMDSGTEARYRREGVRFISELGKALNLSHLTMATASVYFQRFYMFHSFQDFPRYPLSTCCLFLAGKCEETPKKCKDILRTTMQLTNNRIFETFGVDPKEELMALEKVLLQTIHFDLQVDHPYNHLIQYGKSLKGDKSKIEKVVQMSWTFINDSFCTKICLKWEPEIIAVSVMYLAMKLMKFEVKDWVGRQPHQKVWWDQFVENLETSDCEDICHQLLDLYGKPSKNTRDLLESPPPEDHSGQTPFGKHFIHKKSKQSTPESKPTLPSHQEPSADKLHSPPTKTERRISPEGSCTPPPPLPALGIAGSSNIKPPLPSVVPPPMLVPHPMAPPFSYSIPPPLNGHHPYPGYPPPRPAPPTQNPSYPPPMPAPPTPSTGYSLYPPASYYPANQSYFPPGMPPPGISIPPPFPTNGPPPAFHLSQPPPPPPPNVRGPLRY